MTIKQLQYFIELDRDSNFLTASENMYISQSSLSKQIKSLESEIGVELLTRNTRNMQLTVAGTKFKKYALHILQLYDDMMDEMRYYTDKEQTKLRISVIPVASDYGLIEHILAYRKLYPEFDVIVEEQDPTSAFKLLLNKKIDLCIMRSCFITDERCQAIPLVMDEIVMITSSKHPFAQQKEISLSDAANEYYFFLGPATGLHNYCVRLCNAAGFNPMFTEQIFRLSTIQNMVANNQGVSLVMSQVAKSCKNENIKIITLKEHPKMDLSIVIRNEGLSGAAQQFIDFMCKRFNTSSDTRITPTFLGPADKLEMPPYEEI